MTLGCFQVASFLIVYAAFALFQSVARAQPLASRSRSWGRRGPLVVRAAAVGALALPGAILQSQLGWAEALLVEAAALSLAATLFVLCAAPAPRLTWGLALASPVLVAVLLIAGSLR